MSVAAWFKLLSTLVSLTYKITETVQAYQQREQGRLRLLLELRQKRDREKAIAHAIDVVPVPSDNGPLLGGL